MNDARVLIVDDDKFMRSYLAINVDGKYKHFQAASGEDALQALATQAVEVVLLDVELPGIDGFETCRRIKSGNFDPLPSVIFVSAHGDAASRLAAYAAGGDDYLVKPIDPKEILYKVGLALEARREMENLKLSARQAMSAAMSAMSDSGALGVVLHFFRRLFKVDNTADIATAVIESLKEFGLEGTVQVRGGGGPVTVNALGKSSLMEAVLLENFARAEDNIASYGGRTVFNFGLVSALVKNMPVDDEAETGKLKDHLALLVEGASERARSLESVAAVNAGQAPQLILNAIEARYRAQQAEALASVDEMMVELNSLIFMGLTEKQEREMHTILQRGSERIRGVFEQGLEIAKYLDVLKGANENK